MNVAELIEWLKTQDQGATVQVVEHKDGHSYYDQGGNAREVDFNPEKHVDYTDLRGNELITPDKPYFEQRTLLLGLHCG